MTAGEECSHGGFLFLASGSSPLFAGGSEGWHHGL